jgi:hypothetical protein
VRNRYAGERMFCGPVRRNGKSKCSAAWKSRRRCITGMVSSRSGPSDAAKTAIFSANNARNAGIVKGGSIKQHIRLTRWLPLSG